MRKVTMVIALLTAWYWAKKKNAVQASSLAQASGSEASEEALAKARAEAAKGAAAPTAAGGAWK